MDFETTYTPEQEAFRREVRDWLKDNMPEGIVHPADPIDLSEDQYNKRRDLGRSLGSKGWLWPTAPTEYGGGGLSLDHAVVIEEEMDSYGMNIPPYYDSGGRLGGASILVWGTEEQKQRFLPPIMKGEVRTWQLLTEPEAGSDLANVKMSAERDGDDYVINGQKIWTSGAHYGEWYHVLVRTDPEAPKHRGISYIMMQLRDEGKVTEGITLRPLIDMTGTRRWSEVFFDNVRVPARNLIGEENRGWYAAMTTLSFERSGIETAARYLGELEVFLTELRQTRFNGTNVLDDTIVRHKLADLRLELEARRMLSYRVAFMQSKGELPVKEGSMGKAWGDMLGKKVPALFASIMQEYGRLGLGDKRAPMGGYVGHKYSAMHGSGIGGGATEIQRNIIAQRGLGLPR